MRFPRAEPEPESTPEPSAKTSPGASPETSPETSPEPRAPNAEPLPEWPAAKDEWEGAWELHWIGFGLIFFCIAVWSVLSIIQARKASLLVTRRFCYAVNFLLLVFGTTRGLALFLYPYELVANARGTPVVLTRLLFGIGFPCLTAGFTLIHFAFLEAAKVSLSSRKIQSLRFILGVIGLHFLLVVISEVVTSYIPQTSALVILCMLYFIICSLAISVSVLYSGIKVMKESKSHRRTLRKLSVRETGLTGRNSTSQKNNTYSNKESNTNKVARVTMVTAVLGIACAATQIYALAGVFKVRSEGASVPNAWSWWSYQTVSRLIELGLAGTMAYTISQPKKGKRQLQFQCCGTMATDGRAEGMLTEGSHTMSFTESAQSQVRSSRLNDNDL